MAVPKRRPRHRAGSARRSDQLRPLHEIFEEQTVRVMNRLSLDAIHLRRELYEFEHSDYIPDTPLVGETMPYRKVLLTSTDYDIETRGLTGHTLGRQRSGHK